MSSSSLQTEQPAKFAKLTQSNVVRHQLPATQGQESVIISDAGNADDTFLKLTQASQSASQPKFTFSAISQTVVFAFLHGQLKVLHIS
eukprot:m.138858 g.138858  ORF g.138858 m.138858 type:complete len:88 (-) comp15925_c0_seq3:191-454(-)